MRIKDKRLSYVISLFLLFVLVYSLPRLPSVGFSETGSLFTVVWLFFALLVLSSHLKSFFPRDRSISPSKQHIKEKVKLRENSTSKTKDKKQRGEHIENNF